MKLTMCGIVLTGLCLWVPVGHVSVPRLLTELLTGKQNASDRSETHSTCTWTEAEEAGIW